MIIPEHCREVGLKDVDFPLTSENISKSWKGKRIYYRTRFLILRNGDDHCVLRIHSEPNDTLSEIKNVEIISLPDETIWLDDSNIDVLSPGMLVRAALPHAGKTVVVKGSHEHISFVKDPETKTVRVFDIVPPHPPKLVSMMSEVVDSQTLEIPVVVEEEIVDLAELAKAVETEEIVLPCKGDITTGKKVLYLSESPDVKDATLIGCELSRKVARELYGRDLPFIQMCPKRLVGEVDTPTIVKCCELQSGYEVEGKLAIVPWGARIEDVVQATKHLLEGG
jgi:hypothetical protein